MLEFAVEAVGEIITCLLIRIPGAFIRSLFMRKKSFRQCFNDDWIINFVPVFCFLILACLYKGSVDFLRYS